jgi:hypothetical protein
MGSVSPYFWLTRVAASKTSLHEGHGFSRAVEYAIGEGFSPWGTVFQ